MIQLVIPLLGCYCCLLTVDWQGADALFGPADDGGFWALGLRVPNPALLRGVPMSTPGTGAIPGSAVYVQLGIAGVPLLHLKTTAHR